MAIMDLSLPARAPEIACHAEKGHDMLPFAFYNLLDITDDSFKAIARSIRAHYDGEQDHILVEAPRPQFRGGPLRNAFDYHIELGKGGEFHPEFFVALTSDNWKEEGVLFVTLNYIDAGETWYNVDTMLLDPTELCLILVNFQVSNTDWYETKECYALPRPSISQPGPACEQFFEDGTPKRKPLIGFYIGIYSIPHVDIGHLIDDVEPSKDNDINSRRLLRFQKRVSPDNPIEEAAAMHPQQCLANPFLQKNYFLIVDKFNTSESGLAMAHLEWNGDSQTNIAHELAEIGRIAPLKCRQIPCEMFQTVSIFCAILMENQQYLQSRWNIDYGHWDKVLRQ